MDSQKIIPHSWSRSFNFETITNQLVNGNFAYGVI